MWRTIQSFFLGIAKRIGRKRSANARPDRRDSSRLEPPAPIPLVALVAADRDREVLADIAAQQRLELHVAGSYEELVNTASRLQAPLILFDRDWPGTEWRTVIQNLASLPQRACVILVSAVADDYLWQELVHCGGYDTLTKPLRSADVARTMKLALSYWKLAPPAVAGVRR